MGFSTSFGVPTPSLAGGSFPSISAAASNLAHANVVPQSMPHVIPGYSGPTVPDLRANPQVNSVAQQVLGYLFQEIPALAPQQSLGVSVPNSIPLPS